MVIEFDQRKEQTKSIDNAIVDLRKERNTYIESTYEITDEDQKTIDCYYDCINTAIETFCKTIRLYRKKEIINKNADIEKFYDKIKKMNISKQIRKLDAYIAKKTEYFETFDKKMQLGKVSEFEENLYYKCLLEVKKCLDNEEDLLNNQSEFLDLMYEEHQDYITEIEDFILENLEIVEIGDLQIGIPKTYQEEIKEAEKIKIETITKPKKYKRSNGYVIKQKKSRDISHLKQFALNLKKDGLKIYYISERDHRLDGYGTFNIEPFNCK